MERIRYWIEAESIGHWFFVAFPIILISSFIWFKGRRLRFLIPSLLISLVIINPLFYQKWDELGLYAYWRILWVVPVISVIVAVVPSISEQVSKTWLKTIVVVAGVGLIVLGGTFLYSGTGGTFIKAENAAKLPDYVVEVANRLLELDEHPRVIAQDPIGVYIRQYSGNITTLYGRDVYGYILPWTVSEEAKSINNLVNSVDADLSDVSQFMLDNGYEYLVLRDDGRRERIINSQFLYVDHINGYEIYEPVGYPRIVTIRNDLGQIISRTSVDSEGNPIIGIDGYATVEYSYNNYGDVICEFHMDVNGNGAEDENGAAGIEREVDSCGHLVMERKVDKSRKPTKAGRSYAEIRWKYSGNNLIEYAYFDEMGLPTNNSSGFAKAERTFDNKGNIVTENFYDSEGILVEVK